MRELYNNVFNLSLVKEKRYYLFHNPPLRILHETYDILDFFAHRHLIYNLLYSIMDAEIALVNQAVSVGNMAEDSFGRVAML